VEITNHIGSTDHFIPQQGAHLKQAVNVEKKLPSKYFFIDYDVFTNTNHILTSWPGT
jgi:hypothetical protein